MHINNKDAHHLSGTTSLAYREHCAAIKTCGSAGKTYICNSAALDEGVRGGADRLRDSEADACLSESQWSAFLTEH